MEKVTNFVSSNIDKKAVPAYHSEQASEKFKLLNSLYHIKEDMFDVEGESQRE